MQSLYLSYTNLIYVASTYIARKDFWSMTFFDSRKVIG